MCLLVVAALQIQDKMISQSFTDYNTYSVRSIGMLRQFPTARLVQQAFNQPATLEWTYTVPKGKVLAGIYIDVNVTTTGAGMTTVPVSQAIQSLQVYNTNADGSGGLAADIDQYTLDLLAGVSKYLESQLSTYNWYRPVPAILDPVNVATGAALYARWKIWLPLPGVAFKFSMNIPNLQTVWGAGQTGGAIAASIVPIFEDEDDGGRPRTQYYVYAKQSATVTKAAWRNAYIAALFAPSEWGSIQSGINMGGKLSPEEITRVEDLFDDELIAYIAQSASAANPDVKPITDAAVNPVADNWALVKLFETPQLISVGLNTSKTIKAVIFSDLTPDKIAQNAAN